MNGDRNTFIYFAYGSNMLTERLKDRCPGSRLKGCAFADGWEIEFSKRSLDGSGKVTLTKKADRLTPGALFEIPVKELGDLNKAEGYSPNDPESGYKLCREFPVRRRDSHETITAYTYLATRICSGLKPYDWYFALVIAGAHQHKLGEDHVASLRSVKFQPWPPAAKSREKAIEALNEVTPSNENPIDYWLKPNS